MLGVIKSATLDDKDEFPYLLNKTKICTKATMACPVKQHEAAIGYKTIYKPCMTYPLCALSLNERQIQKLHMEIIPKILPRMGYQRTFPMSISFGSKFSGGLGMMNINTSQLHVWGKSRGRVNKYVLIRKGLENNNRTDKIHLCLAYLKYI